MSAAVRALRPAPIDLRCIASNVETIENCTAEALDGLNAAIIAVQDEICWAEMEHHKESKELARAALALRQARFALTAARERVVPLDLMLAHLNGPKGGAA